MVSFMCSLLAAAIVHGGDDASCAIEETSCRVQCSGRFLQGDGGCASCCMSEWVLFCECPVAALGFRGEDTEGDTHHFPWNVKTQMTPDMICEQLSRAFECIENSCRQGQRDVSSQYQQWPMVPLAQLKDAAAQENLLMSCKKFGSTDERDDKHATSPRS